MVSLLRDPIVLITAGILLLGLIVLVWAAARLFGKSTNGRPGGTPEALAGLGGEDLAAEDDTFRDPLLSRQEVAARAPEPAPAGGGGGDVRDRLEMMSQRLAEMQAVLSRQAGGGAIPSQGFSPETVDKLLKIIGNVAQQVDILQRALNLPKEGQAAPNRTP